MHCTRPPILLPVLCVQVNEAFAAQCLAVAKELRLDPERINVNGGAIALGHPLGEWSPAHLEVHLLTWSSLHVLALPLAGASGSRITAHLVHEMKRRGATWAIGSACIGGGQGIALLLQKV